MLPLIYRLEDRRGVGVYSANFARSIDTIGDYWSPSHPSPRVDPGMDCFRSGRHIFGFGSHHTARLWFYNRKDLLLWGEGGLRLAIWPQEASTEIVRGQHQIAFRRPEVPPLYLEPIALHDLTVSEITQCALAFF